jgi:hypothetical protein
VGGKPGEDLGCVGQRQRLDLIREGPQRGRCRSLARFHLRADIIGKCRSPMIRRAFRRHPLGRYVERAPERPVLIGVDTHPQFGATSGPPRGEDRPRASCNPATSRMPGEGLEPSRPHGQRILSQPPTSTRINTSRQALRITGLRTSRPTLATLLWVRVHGEKAERRRRRARTCPTPAWTRRGDADVTSVAGPSDRSRPSRKALRAISQSFLFVAHDRPRDRGASDAPLRRAPRIA